jgi:hypothetical protein
MSLALFSAADGNCIGLATELLDDGASVDARDRFGARPLSHAARFGHLEMVDLLLARGAPTDARNLAGATALYFAAEGGHGRAAAYRTRCRRQIRRTQWNFSVAAAAYAGSDGSLKRCSRMGRREPDDTGKPPIVMAAARARLIS